MKKCCTCKQLKDESGFSIDRTTRDGLCNRCKKCYVEYNKKYCKKYYKEHKRECKASTIEWQKENPEIHNKYHKKSAKKWREKNPKYMREWRKKNPEKRREHDAKNHAKRKRNLGWKLLWSSPFNICEEVEGHHINDKYIVYLPKDLHRLGGIYNGTNIESHRINLSYIVDQIYGDN